MLLDLQVFGDKSSEKEVDFLMMALEEKSNDQQSHLNSFSGGSGCHGNSSKGCCYISFLN